MGFQNSRSHLTGWNVVFPLPDFEVLEIINLVVVLYLKRPAFVNRYRPHISRSYHNGRRS